MPNFTHSLNIVARCTRMQREGKLKSLQIGGGQVPYLLRLHRCPGLTQEELAKALYVNKSTAARAIANLERAGYVERRPSPDDRRRYLLFLTEKAEIVLPQVRSTVHEWNDYLLEDFTEEEQEALVGMLERVAKRAQKYIQSEGTWEE